MCGTVGVLDIDLVFSEGLGDFLQRTDFVFTFNQEHISFHGESAVFLEEFQCLVGTVDNQTDDHVIDGVGSADRPDIDLFLGQDFADGSEHAGTVGDEQGELRGDLHSIKIT